MSDLTEGIYRLLISDVNEPVNLGNPTEMRISDFATKIIELTGSRSDIVFQRLPVDDPKVRQPDITRARELLGWQPQVPLDEGLRQTIEFFKM